MMSLRSSGNIHYLEKKHGGSIIRVIFQVSSTRWLRRQ